MPPPAATAPSIDPSAPPQSWQYLTFRVGEEEYGIPILAVQEIRGRSTITPLPNALPHLPGVMNLRGTIVPVVDLRVRFALPKADGIGFAVIILIVVETKIVGLAVDTVSDVVELAATEIHAVPDIGARVADGSVTGFAQAGERLIVLLDPAKVLEFS